MLCNFKIFIFLTFALSVALYVMAYTDSLFKFDDVDATCVFIIAVLSLVMSIVEIIMWKAPAQFGATMNVFDSRYKGIQDINFGKATETVLGNADEVDMDYLLRESFSGQRR